MRLGVDASREVSIHRQEIEEAIRRRDVAVNDAIKRQMAAPKANEIQSGPPSLDMGTQIV